MASFIVPSFAKRWTRFAFRVASDSDDQGGGAAPPSMMKNGLDSGSSGLNVTFFFNCREYGTIVSSILDTTPLTFDTASTLYIAQAGAILNGEFLVRNNPNETAVTFETKIEKKKKRWKETQRRRVCRS